MRLFISDLDNTLIYSYKKDIGEDRVLVEEKDGKALSYMTVKSHELLERARRKYCFVPATTRSLEQYLRICFFPGWTPKYALVCNGGILLREGKQDGRWYEESLELCAGAEQDLAWAERALAADPEVSFEIRRVGGLFVFTKSGDAEGTMRRLRETLNPERVEILSNGSKVYVMPRELNKGAAVRRLRALTGAEAVFAAGDSEFDVSMLAEADRGFLPCTLGKELGAVICTEGSEPGSPFAAKNSMPRCGAEEELSRCRYSPAEDGILFSDWFLEELLKL